MALVHGDDLLTSGEEADLEWSCGGLKKNFATKIDDGGKRRHGQGGESTEPNRGTRERRSLVRRIPHIHRYSFVTQDGEPSGRQLQETGKDTEDDKDDALSAVETIRYRRFAARANHLAPDRMDIAYATKEATRRMTVPTKDDWNKLVRLGRYCARYPKLMNWYRYQGASDNVVACTDSDWAGVQKQTKIDVWRVHSRRTAHA